MPQTIDVVFLVFHTVEAKHNRTSCDPIKASPPTYADLAQPQDGCCYFKVYPNSRTIPGQMLLKWIHLMLRPSMPNTKIRALVSLRGLGKTEVAAARLLMGSPQTAYICPGCIGCCLYSWPFSLLVVPGHRDICQHLQGWCTILLCGDPVLMIHGPCWMMIHGPCRTCLGSTRRAKQSPSTSLPF